MGGEKRRVSAAWKDTEGWRGARTERIAEIGRGVRGAGANKGAGRTLYRDGSWFWWPGGLRTSTRWVTAPSLFFPPSCLQANTTLKEIFDGVTHYSPVGGIWDGSEVRGHVGSPAHCDCGCYSCCPDRELHRHDHFALRKLFPRRELKSQTSVTAVWERSRHNTC